MHSHIQGLLQVHDFLDRVCWDRTLRHDVLARLRLVLSILVSDVEACAEALSVVSRN